jgi:hypothetical protein
VVPTNIAGRLLRRIIDTAAEYLLTKVVPDSKSSMICSEFVYRCYDEALPAQKDEYSLLINQLVAKGMGPLAFIGPYNKAPADTLLAWASAQELARASLLPRAFTGMRPVAHVERKPLEKSDEDSLDALLERYFREVDQGETVPFSQVQTPELLADVRYLAAAFVQSTKEAPVETLQLKGFKPSDIPDVVRMFLRTCADFVTPADLERCAELITMGNP